MGAHKEPMLEETSEPTPKVLSPSFSPWKKKEPVR